MDKKKKSRHANTSTEDQPNYDFWIQQSKMFFDSLSSFKDFFKNDYLNPSKHQEQINLWLSVLKKQAQSLEEASSSKTDWHSMNKIMLQAAELMVATWMKRAKQDDPVQSIQELYQLWMNNCREIYQKTWMHAGTQDVFQQWLDMFKAH